MDELERVMREDGFMRNNFAFLVDEVKEKVGQILDEVEIRV